MVPPQTRRCLTLQPLRKKGLFILQFSTVHVGNWTRINADVRGFYRLSSAFSALVRVPYRNLEVKCLFFCARIFKHKGTKYTKGV